MLLAHRALLGRPLDMYDVARFDPQLGSQLERLWAALMAHRHACSAAGVCMHHVWFVCFCFGLISWHTVTRAVQQVFAWIVCGLCDSVLAHYDPLLVMCIHFVQSAFVYM